MKKLQNHRLLMAFIATCTLAGPLSGEEVLRGFNLSMYSPDTGELTRHDFEQMQEIGTTLVRLDFSKIPLMDKEPPYDFNEGHFKRLHKYIRWSESLGLKVVIDPHTFPGTFWPWTIMGTDPFWYDVRYKEMVVKLWDRIARELNGYGDVIWAYDLMNEPYGGGTGAHDDHAWDLNDAYKELIRTIRKHDRTHPIMLMFSREDFIGNYARPPAFYEDPVNKLIYSPHMYWPTDFAFQGIDPDLSGSKPGQKYPDPEKGWTREDMAEHLQPFFDFKEEHDVEMFFGEFSNHYGEGTCWDKNDRLNMEPKLGGHTWLIDVVELLEANGCHWTYHGYEDYEGWDATVPHPRWVLMQRFLDPDGSFKPSSELMNPVDGAVFEEGDDIHLKAGAWDFDGTIAKVQFYNGTIVIGEDSEAPYDLSWTAPLGSHRLTAKAIDNTGDFQYSRPVDIAVTKEVPGPWKAWETASLIAPASAWEDDGTWHLQAADDDLYKEGLGFLAVTQSLEGSVSLTVKVGSMSGTEKACMAGIAMIDSREGAKKIARIGFSGDGHARWQVFDAETGMAAIQPDGWAYAPGWLKLVREKNLFSAFHSEDGKTWQQLGATVYREMPASIEVGIFAQGAPTSDVNKATFSDPDLQQL